MQAQREETGPNKMAQVKMWIAHTYKDKRHTTKQRILSRMVAGMSSLHAACKLLTGHFLSGAAQAIDK